MEALRRGMNYGKVRRRVARRHFFHQLEVYLLWTLGVIAYVIFAVVGVLVVGHALEEVWPR